MMKTGIIRLIVIVFVPLVLISVSLPMEVSAQTWEQTNGPYGAETQNLPVTIEDGDEPPVSSGYNPCGGQQALTIPASAEDIVTLTYHGSSLWGGIFDVDVVDGLAYCAMTNGLAIVNVDDSSNPVLVSQLIINNGHGRAIEVEGDYAYLADGGMGLQIIDISSPENPIWAGGYTTLTPSYSLDVAVQGGLAFITHGDTGISIVDVGDPTNPTLAGGFDTPGYASRITVHENHAYISEGDSGLYIYDISNPESPVMVSHIETLQSVSYVVVSETLAYVTAADGLHIFDISSPVNPSFVGAHATSAAAITVALVDEYAFVSHVDGLDIVDISDTEQPVLAVSVGGGMQFSRIEISAGGTMAYAVSNYFGLSGDTLAGLHIVNIATPNELWQTGTYVTAYAPYRVAISDKICAVVNGQTGVHFLDLSNPTAPLLLGHFQSPVWSRDVVIVDELAYVADRDSGLQIVDIGDPSAPVQRSMVPVPGQSDALAVDGNYAYVLAERSGMHIINVADPDNPFVEGIYGLSVNTNQIVVRGDYAYITGFEIGFQIIDVSDPSSPVYVSSALAHTIIAADAIALRGDYAIVGRGSRIKVL